MEGRGKIKTVRAKAERREEQGFGGGGGGRKQIKGEGLGSRGTRIDREEDGDKSERV